MENSKLIRLLKTFTKQEWKEFEKFCCSPYFNKGRNYTMLVKELKKFYPEFLLDNNSRENLYSTLYPSKKYKETVMFTILSGLYNLAEEFIVQQKLKESANIKNPILLNELSSRELKHDVEAMIHQTQNKYNSNMQGIDDYFNRSLMYSQIMNHYYANDDKKNLMDTRILYTVYVIYDLLIKIMGSEFELISMKTYFKTDFYMSYLGKLFSCFDINKIMKLAGENDNEHYGFISITYYMLMARKHPANDEYYFRLKHLAEDYYNKLDFDMNTRNYWYLSSLCASKINMNKDEFYAESFKIFEKILEYKLYTNTEGALYFDNGLFKNIITIGLYLKKTAWTESFVKLYIDKIDPQQREHMLSYSMANIEFVKKNFEKALYYSQKIEQKLIIYKLDIKNLMARIYYETGDVEPLYSLLDTYIHLVKSFESGNKKISVRHLNFIKFLKKLVSISLNNIDTEINSLKLKIAGTKYLNGKNWLLEKIAELEK